MTAIAMSVDECRSLTAKLYGEDRDYSYITQALIDSDAALGKEVVKTKSEFSDFYGNNPRLGYWTIDGVQIAGTNVDYDVNGSIGEGCGSSKTAWMNPNIWVQESFGTCPNGKFQIRFW